MLNEMKETKQPNPCTFSRLLTSVLFLLFSVASVVSFLSSPALLPLEHCSYGTLSQLLKGKIHPEIHKHCQKEKEKLLSPCGEVSYNQPNKDDMIHFQCS